LLSAPVSPLNIKNKYFSIILINLQLLAKYKIIFDCLAYEITICFLHHFKSPNNKYKTNEHKKYLIKLVVDSKSSHSVASLAEQMDSSPYGAGLNGPKSRGSRF